MRNLKITPELIAITRKLGLGEPGIEVEDDIVSWRRALAWKIRRLRYIWNGTCGPPEACKLRSCRRKQACRLLVHYAGPLPTAKSQTGAVAGTEPGPCT